MGDERTPPTGQAPRPRIVGVPTPQGLEPVAATDADLQAHRELVDDLRSRGAIAFDTPIPSTVPEPPLSSAGAAIPLTLDDIYRLIDQRMPTTIAAKIESLPPPPKVPTLPSRRDSLPVRAVKSAAKPVGRWSKIAVYATGIFMLLTQGVAWIEQYRGPIGQAFVIAAKVADYWESSHSPVAPAPAADPELEPQ